MRPYQDDDIGDRAHIRHAEAIIIIFQPERESVCMRREEPSCSLLLPIIGKSCTIHWEGERFKLPFVKVGLGSRYSGSLLNKIMVSKNILC